MAPMWRHLFQLSLAEWRHHPWRHGVALLAVALGVALASSVQMINASALAEFAQAVRSVNGQPDASAAAVGPDGLDDGLLARLLLDPAVAIAVSLLIAITAADGMLYLYTDDGNVGTLPMRMPSRLSVQRLFPSSLVAQ